MYKKVLFLFSYLVIFALSFNVFAYETVDPKYGVSYFDKDAQTHITVYNAESPIQYVFDGTGNDVDKVISARAKSVILLQLDNYAAVTKDELKWIDRENVQVKPYVDNGRTMVPLRFITEELGAVVTYDDTTRKITVKLNDDILELVVDKSEFTLNGVVGKLETPATIVENRTFVPVRLVAESLKHNVTWLENDRIIIITPLNRPWLVDNDVEKETLSRVRLMISPLIRDLAYGGK